MFYVAEISIKTSLTKAYLDNGKQSVWDNAVIPLLWSKRRQATDTWKFL